MTDISRRQLAGLSLAFPLTLLATAVVAQEPRPEVKWSEARPIIKEYVDRMSAAYKQSTGVEFTTDQKELLIASIMANMQAQHIYAFVDP